MAQDKARSTRARKKKDETEVPSAATGSPRAIKAARPRLRKRTAGSPSSEAVAVYAYLLWESGEPGDATEHWFRAERELAAA